MVIHVSKITNITLEPETLSIGGNPDESVFTLAFTLADSVEGMEICFENSQIDELIELLQSYQQEIGE